MAINGIWVNRACGTTLALGAALRKLGQPTLSLSSRRRPGPTVATAREAEIGVPAFPTDQVRGLKAHGMTKLRRRAAAPSGQPRLDDAAVEGAEGEMGQRIRP